VPVQIDDGSVAVASERSTSVGVPCRGFTRRVPRQTRETAHITSNADDVVVEFDDYSVECG